MKTIKSILCALCFVLIMPLNLQAQEENESFILNVTEFTIKFGQDANFTDGVQKWNKCYKENNGTGKWRVWNRVQGKGNVYVLASRMDNWAEMDESDPAGKACRSIATTFIIPHIESTEYNITRSLPKVSNSEPLGDNTVVWVTSFKVKNNSEFTRIVKDVSSTMAEKEGGNRGYWYRTMGGDWADYFVSVPYKNFADIDTDRDGVWTVYESVHGEAKTKETRQAFRESLDDAWSYIYTLNKDLSMQ